MRLISIRGISVGEQLTVNTQLKMKATKMIKKISLALTFAAAMATNTMAQDQDNAAFLVASLEVSDLNAYFERYGGPVFPMLAAAGAEVIVGSPSVATLEGDYGATWTAIVKFPSMDALNTWYASEEYQAIAPERRSLTDQDASFLFAAPAFVMPEQ